MLVATNSEATEIAILFFLLAPPACLPACLPAQEHVGLIVAWAPPLPDDPMQLWKLRHSDGDIEDLEEVRCVWN